MPKSEKLLCVLPLLGEGERDLITAFTIYMYVDNFACIDVYIYAWYMYVQTLNRLVFVDKHRWLLMRREMCG